MAVLFNCFMVKCKVIYFYGKENVSKKKSKPQTSEVHKFAAYSMRNSENEFPSSSDQQQYPK